MSPRTVPRAAYPSPDREADAFPAGLERVNRRRALCTLLGLSLGPSAVGRASAQSGAKTPVIGLLDAGQRLQWWAAFRKEMHELGYVESRTVAYAERFAAGKFER